METGKYFHLNNTRTVADPGFPRRGYCANLLFWPFPPKKLIRQSGGTDLFLADYD